MHTQKYDFVIIGAGILGLSMAMELRKRYPNASIAVLEKEISPGKHASGRNSGVLHSGIYYNNDTLKAKVCSAGNMRMRQFADEHGIHYKSSGKIIIATCKKDIPVVERLLDNAKHNKVSADRLDEHEIKKIEPFSNPYKVGIYSPDTAVIDGPAVIRKICELLSAQKVDLLYRQEVVGVSLREQKVKTKNCCYVYGFLFNCAGAYADRIAFHFGLCQNYVLLPFKGIYYKIRPDKQNVVKSNIYPVPDINLPFLGVHLTKVINGELYAGPTAIPALGRENYGVLEGARILEGMEIARHLLRMYVSNHNSFRKLIYTELRKYFKHNFAAAIRRLVPALTADDLIPCTKVGIRPQLIDVNTKKLEMDYIIEQTPTSMHVLNAISPAFTSAFAFGELLADRLEKKV